MRKIIFLILCACIVITCFSSCNYEQGSTFSDTNECEHEYASFVTKEPTYDAEGEMTYVCGNCDNTYTESIPKLEKHVVPTSVLDKALSNSKYFSGIFSISVGELVNSAVNNYEIKYLSGEEAIKKGYVDESEIDDSIDIDYFYYAIISGDCKVNPSIPYMTNYEAEAVKVWMVFDEDDKLLNSGVALCQNLQTYAILIMSSSY